MAHFFDFEEMCLFYIQHAKRSLDGRSNALQMEEAMRIEQQNSILEMLQQNSGVEEKGSTAVFKEKMSVSKSKHSDTQSVFIKDSTYLNPALA